MLARAARRTSTHPASIRRKVLAEQLYLPWLCPAYNAPRRELRKITVDGPAQTLVARKRRNSQDGSRTPSRNLATAVTSSAIHHPLDDIPFEYGNTYASSQPTQSSPVSPLNHFGTMGPLMLGGSLAIAPQRIRNSRDGLGGDFHEINSIYKACLQVGRLERAGVILKRMASFTAATPEDLLVLHNMYLKSAVSQISIRQSSAANQALHKWFELEIRNAGLPMDAETIGWMLKASLYSSDSDQKSRLVRRYMDISRQNDLDLADVAVANILNAEELNQIFHLDPEHKPDYEALVEDEPELEVALDHAPEVHSSSTSSPAEVRAVAQKGLGLKALKQTLSLFTENDAEGLNLSARSPEEQREIQTRLETNAVRSAIDRWREESVHLKKMGFDTHLQTKSLGARMWRWSLDLKNAIEKELKRVEVSEASVRKSIADTERCQYGPFLRLLATDKQAAVTILAIMSTFGKIGADKGVPLAMAIMEISGGVEDEALFEIVERTNKNAAWASRMEKGKKHVITAAQIRKAKRSHGSSSVQHLSSGVSEHTNSIRFSGDNSIREALAEAEWPTAIKAKIGAFLMSALIEVAQVPVNLQNRETGEMVTQMQPAFTHSYQLKQGKRIGTILANKVLVRQLQREPVHGLLAKHLPMLVGPDPWTQFGKGGFLSQPAKVMRIKLGDKDQRHYAEAAIGQGDMEQTFKGLDVLGKTPWRINQPVFDIMLEAWNSGDAIANIAPENPKLDIPPEPDVNSVDPFERRNWIRAVKIVENTKSGLHSQRCFQNFQLEIARSLRNETFYFPHNVDFRGRAYPIPPYLNHMGADHCRGLLQFGKGKALGESGLRWLKIHLANVFGFDKASLSEREAFAVKHLAKINETAINPLKGSRWWLNAEDPWQFLAASIELKNALDSPDPTKFVSYLPIHQDGTCNGLQHYAALGGDSWGAKQVNLEPGDRPADVYTAVANLVKESIALDKEKGNAIATVLDGRVTRKIVKQTVMTNVYGVTYIGAKAQVRKALVSLYDDLPNDKNMHAGILAAYIATKIFAALSSMFRGAHDIQYWLGECASRISMCVTAEQMDLWEAEKETAKTSDKAKAEKLINPQDGSHFKSSVIWTNPLHMPVVQPYRVAKTKIVHTNMQSINLSEPHRWNPVSKRKQLQGFPPNFVHSLDATHMLLSALRCDELGLSFAAVHDSFWTHASDLDTMNEVLRDTFIRIHSEDVIGRLNAEFQTRYKDGMYLAKVRGGSDLHKKIVQLRRKLSQNQKGFKMTELLMERKRCRLLASSDPKEVEEGRKMVTPGSLFEEFDGEVAAEVELAGIGLGEVSTRRTATADDEEIESQGEEALDVDNVMGEEQPKTLATHRKSSNSLKIALSIDHENFGDQEKAFEKAAVHSTAKTGQATTGYVWRPLQFPAVPVKGDFDVTRLKNSKYFFS